jgi:HD superfamily phosphodiesterase
LTREEAIESMEKYFGESIKYIEHTHKVLAVAEQILDSEGVNDSFVNDVVVLSTIFHDIGIPEAERKYNSPAAEYQEKEGGPIARELLSALKVRPDILERVVYIVRNHHTMEKVDGMDFQVLWEADFIVNIDEKNITVEKGSEIKAIEENFITNTGTKLISGMFS